MKLRWVAVLAFSLFFASGTARAQSYSVFTTATVAANTAGPWIPIPDGFEIAIDFTSATTSAATEDVWLSNDNTITAGTGIKATASPNTSIVNPSAAAHQGFIVRSYRFFSVAVTGWSSGTLTTTYSKRKLP